MRSSSRLPFAILMAASAASLIALDLWTKTLAAAGLAGKGAVKLLGGFVVLVYTRNQGAFLSLGSSLPPILRTIILIVLPIAALGFLAWAFLRRGFFGEGAKASGFWRSRGAEMAIAVLVFAGGVGNLVDRILYGKVRDFVYFMFWKIPTGIMNLADLYILAALIVAVVAFARNSAKAREGVGNGGSNNS
jgi:signal peptidase II